MHILTLFVVPETLVCNLIEQMLGLKICVYVYSSWAPWRGFKACFNVIHIL